MVDQNQIILLQEILHVFRVFQPNARFAVQRSLHPTCDALSLTQSHNRHLGGLQCQQIDPFISDSHVVVGHLELLLLSKERFEFFRAGFHFELCQFHQDHGLELFQLVFRHEGLVGQHVGC